MASWIVTPNNQYVQIAQLSYVMVVDDPVAGWSIVGYLPSCASGMILKTGYATQAAATTALTTAIGNLGGSI